MQKTTLYTDPELGQIAVQYNPRARHIILRAQSGGIRITLPYGSTVGSARNALERFREPLKKRQQKIKSTCIDFGYRIDTPLFKLSLEKGARACFFVRYDADETVIIFPPDTVFADAERQQWLRKVIEKEMQRKALQLLPSRLESLSQFHRLPFRSVKITTAKSRWGSCSAHREIRLSCYLLLLPTHLIDYVMLHELTHTCEMNHGERFWELLDRLTDGQARSLRSELRQFNTSF